MIDVRERLRALCMNMPKVTERQSHGEPAWFVGRAPQFATLADHHHNDRVAFWAAAPPGAQQDWVTRDPGRFFVPPYVGGRGWIGVYLDVEQDWDEIADIVADAYSTVSRRPGT